MEKLLSTTVSLATNGAGLISTSIHIQDPSGAPNWASLANVYDEYRVLAAAIHYLPANGYNKIVATQSCANPIFVVLDRDSATALTTVSGATSYDSVRMFDLERPFKFNIFRMSGSNEAKFISTAAAATIGAYLLVSVGNTASLTYGTVLVQWLVQFRASA